MEELEKRLAGVHLDVPIYDQHQRLPERLCPDQIADIGLKGMIVTDASGTQVEGFQVHLGGGLGLDAGFGRKVRGTRSPGTSWPTTSNGSSRRFDEQREAGERFAQWVLRADEDDLK